MAAIMHTLDRIPPRVRRVLALGCTLLTFLGLSGLPDDVAGWANGLSWVGGVVGTWIIPCGALLMVGVWLILEFRDRRGHGHHGNTLPSALIQIMRLEAVQSDPDLEHYLNGQSVGGAVEHLAQLFVEGKRLKRTIELSSIAIVRSTVAGTAARDQVVRERAAREWDAEVSAAIAPFGNHYRHSWESEDGLPDVNPALAMIEPTTNVQGLRVFLDAKLARLREILEQIGEGQVGRC